MCWNNYYRICNMKNVKGIKFIFTFKITHGQSRVNSASLVKV